MSGFVAKYEPKKKSAKNVVVKKLLSTETVIKEAKILKELQHKKIVSLKAVWEEPMTMMSDSPF